MASKKVVADGVAVQHRAIDSANPYARFANDPLAVYLRKELDRAALREKDVLERPPATQE